MHIHILGICGTFMGSLALLAKAMGHKVTGSDVNVYPPMSTQLEQAGIKIESGFASAHLEPRPDLVVIGNAISRGNEAVEYVLNEQIPYTSGPQWLADYVLQDKWVLGVAGTHGKTTTSSMLAWILEYAGMSPGFLIGGVPENFGVSARLGETPFFVVEADEYDSAFFDKRSKFVHYHPRTLILNNLEFDHADIFSSLADIQRQFHHLVRTVPGNGLIIYPSSYSAMEQVMTQGCWSATQTIGQEWQAQLQDAAGRSFSVIHQGTSVGEVSWTLTGQHNVENALAAIAAARHVGVIPALACEALAKFVNVKRRMECIYEDERVTVYDDFAHHPTAITTTLEGLRKAVNDDHIIAILEPRSNTMKMGIHTEQLAACVKAADEVIWFEPEGLTWSLDDVMNKSEVKSVKFDDVASIVDYVAQCVDKLDSSSAKTHVLLMSNGGFGGIYHQLTDTLSRNKAL
ncbi:UDP-N-acetylmuramate:L-alanyl-gamma-D-glutamyl-meso-diaminopimelate ligase [Zooshikella marina]|uniref:UDP-N-acetylmuramate:L-alanyl-gamma-D-glutamyl- meso-diaminopimelate ligase n=1 Tax=Zooshikella ganghwensis TaxID=202772 RepID=UPI001BAF65C1|nr:UDP-N-acetylmuramate:L-alanyl-gamma-D-glutamyl-meso-diaminopimelate ligase [Zooshikella ganghwensis]MBU2706614.1 UDP-N-acetylmuramate:L-alanyl-gamma-D-glutamyl-meso-diaminopimelate ligase [Zooshikella ganghwensis]